MKATDTPDRYWQPWVIVADEAARRPVLLYPEHSSGGLTGNVEIEVPYTDYGCCSCRDAELTVTLTAEVLVAAMERLGYEVRKK